jgi:hypothetical protein
MEDSASAQGRPGVGPAAAAQKRGVPAERGSGEGVEDDEQDADEREANPQRAATGSQPHAGAGGP